MYVTEFNYFNLNWIAIMSIPEDSVMADINAKKYETLTYGLIIALVVKALVSGIIRVVKGCVQTRLYNKRLEDAARKDVEEGVEARMPRASVDGDHTKDDVPTPVAAAAGVAVAATTASVAGVAATAVLV